MRRILSNRSFWLFAAVQLVSLSALAAGGHALEDVIGSFVILGVLLPGLALAACWGLPSPGAPQPWRPVEGWIVGGLLVAIALFLAVKGPLLAALLPAGAGPRLHDTVNTLLKLVAFVAVPAVVLRSAGVRWEQAGPPTGTRHRLWIIFVVLSVAAVAVQYFLGSQFRKVFGAAYVGHHVWLAAVLSFAWLAVEAGLVEEFFFRWFLQTRLAAWTRSEVSGVFLSALLFGLAHAPGIWLRGAGAVEGLGETPSLGTTLAYVMATQGVTGLMFGVLWARTRSFALLVALHAMVDMPAGLASFMDTWGL